METHANGNSLGTAHNLGVLSDEVTYQGAVNPDNPVDYLRFTIEGSVRKVRARLDGVSQQTWLELIEDANGNGFVDSGEILASGYSSSAVTRDLWLDPGVYYVRVRPRYSDRSTEYTLTLSEIPKPESPGRNDNTLLTARNLGVLNGTITVNDFVGTSDPVDFLRFTIEGSVRKVRARLDGVSTSTWLELIEDVNGNGLVDSGEILASGYSSSSVTRDLWLDPGVYYIRVRPYSGVYGIGSTEYTLTLAETPRPESPGRNDNSLPTARNLGVLNGTITVNDFVGTSDPVDFLRFTIDGSVRKVRARLDGVSTSTWLELIEDANGNGIVDSGEVLASGRSSSSVSHDLWLDPGVYYIRVRPYSGVYGIGSTEYTLTLSETPRPESPGRNDNALLTARNLGVLNGVLTVNDFVGTSDRVDYYRFTVTEPAREITARLDGLSTSTWLELIEDANGNGIVDSGEVLASGRSSSSVSHDLWLDPGVYYIRVRPYSGVYGIGSTEYTLTLAIAQAYTDNLPDLVVSALSVGSANVLQGERVTVTFSVANMGTGAAPATPARVRLAAGTTITLADPLLSQVTVGALEPGAARTLSEVVTIPPGTAPGDWYMGVTANATGPVEESNPYNNQRTVPITVESGEVTLIEQTPTGFVYPLGRSGPYAMNMPGWLAGGPEHGPYRMGYYHLGQDMEARAGDPVYAIADGEIVHVSTGGWGTGNYGLLVRHRLSGGQEFIALYGHVRPLRSDLRSTFPRTVSPPIAVRAGEAFATVGPADGVAYRDTHLHFGVRPGGDVPSAPFGLMPLTQWPAVNGFVDPMDWIETQSPQDGLSTPQAPPAAPRSVIARAIQDGQVQLTWEAGCAAAEGFRVERRTGTSGQWGTLSVSDSGGRNTQGETQSFTVLAAWARSLLDSVLPGRRYFYRLVAFNDAGDSDYSGETSVNVPASGGVEPEIHRVDPPKPIATGSAQSFTIYGENFADDATVNLRVFDGTPGGRFYENREISSFRSDSHLTINPNFGNRSGKWSVEVVNPGAAPELYDFAVVLPPVPDILPTDGFDYPIGCRGYAPDGKQISIPEFPDERDHTPEINDLYCLDNTLDNPPGSALQPGTRVRAEPGTDSAGRYYEVLNVRDADDIDTVIAQVRTGSTGMIVDGPIDAEVDGVMRVWYNVEWAGDEQVAGWSHGGGLTSAVFRLRAIRPTSGWFNGQDVGSYFPAWGGLHSGEDWNLAGRWAVGEPVYAVADGIVANITSEGGGTIVVLHKCGRTHQQYYSIYTHVNTNEVYIGKKVERGKPIASIADYNPPHLHFEMRKRVRDLGPGQSIHELTSNWYYHGGDGPHRNEMTATQVENAFAQMRSEGILDPSDFIDSNRPPVPSGAIANGFFALADGLVGWSRSGQGVVDTIQLLGDAYSTMASLTLEDAGAGGSGTQGGIWMPLDAPEEISMRFYQAIDTPNDPFVLHFSYLFRDTVGTLDVMLNSVVLATLTAPDTLSDDPFSLVVRVDDPELMGLASALLEFRFSGPSGATVLLSNIVLVPALPEDDVVYPLLEGPLEKTADGIAAWLDIGVPAHYRIEYSDDLVHWHELVTLPNLTEGVRVDMPSPAATDRRFYRARVVE